MGRAGWQTSSTTTTPAPGESDAASKPSDRINPCARLRSLTERRDRPPARSEVMYRFFNQHLELGHDEASGFAERDFRPLGAAEPRGAGPASRGRCRHLKYVVPSSYSA